MIVYILPSDNSSLVSVDKTAKIESLSQLKADIEQIAEKVLNSLFKCLLNFR